MFPGIQCTMNSPSLLVLASYCRERMYCLCNVFSDPVPFASQIGIHVSIACWCCNIETKFWLPSSAPFMSARVDMRRVIFQLLVICWGTTKSGAQTHDHPKLPYRLCPWAFLSASKVHLCQKNHFPIQMVTYTLRAELGVVSWWLSCHGVHCLAATCSQSTHFERELEKCAKNYWPFVDVAEFLCTLLAQKQWLMTFAHKIVRCVQNGSSQRICKERWTQQNWLLPPG